MDIHVNTAVRVVLTLSENEARWLQALVQNPIAETETIEDGENRRNLFESIKRVLR